MSKLTHKQLETFVTDTLSKREPCPAMVLAWGWMLKQGEGGLFHGDTFKQRYFVLARVPHATVLIYYGQKTMDEDHILGYIDLRNVTAVREATRPVVVDGAKTGGGGGGFLGKIRGAFGGSAAATTAPTRPVVELTTKGRTYVLCPQTIGMPPPMTTAAAVAASYAKPLYLFGWPFPVPPLDPTDDEAEVADAFMEGRTPPEAFSQWRDVLATAVAAEKVTRQFPVVTLVDSTGQLPQRVILRTTPCELAIVSVEDKDTCFAAVPYNDLLKWDLQASGEIAINARTRARLVAKSDKTGFSSQRPTRPTCHFVIKAAQAGSVLQVIDNHLRALAKQLAGLGDGADETESAPAEPDSAAAGAGLEDDNEGVSAASKLTSKKPKSSPKADSSSDDDEPEKPAKKPVKPKKAASSSSGSESDKPAARKPTKPAKKVASSDEESDEAPKKPTRKPSPQKAASSESEEEVKPKKPSKPTTAKAKPKKKESSSDEKDISPPPGSPDEEGEAAKPKKAESKATEEAGSKSDSAE